MLEETLEQCVRKIKGHRSGYEQNETEVRAQIVNPILRGLGWDPEDPEKVRHNLYTDEGGVPDYTLIKNGKEVLFIEAKNLSVDIERKEVIGQLAKYCYDKGMKYGVLTNGAIWKLFRAFQEGTKIEDRGVWKTNIESDKLTETIRRLNTISEGNIENIDKLIKKHKILDEIWKYLLAEPGKMIEGFIPVFDKLINERYSEYEFESHEIEDFLKGSIEELIEKEIMVPPPPPPPPPPPKPTRMWIDNDAFLISNWNEILTNTAEWLIKQGKVRRNQCPILVSPQFNS